MENLHQHHSSVHVLQRRPGVLLHPQPEPNLEVAVILLSSVQLCHHSTRSGRQTVFRHLPVPRLRPPDLDYLWHCLAKTELFPPSSLSVVGRWTSNDFDPRDPVGSEPRCAISTGRAVSGVRHVFLYMPLTMSDHCSSSRPSGSPRSGHLETDRAYLPPTQQRWTSRQTLIARTKASVEAFYHSIMGDRTG
ncbi:putative proline-rich receptor-like protein kinase PERK8 [Iris pallida]|uniref:Proline-rich receptor-like protein kinase PERK8 n=1 Tax=Iris pallida TaxID=29817 RepID=A0AAX6HWW8_IRIPA|nr:putative proline-rich receptor-like protein kinase PERK8 [Iris pallida]